MQVIGCDVSKATLDAAAPVSDDGSFGELTKVPNRRAGWQRLLRWMSEVTGCEASQLCLVVEASGVYHLPLVMFMSAHGVRILIANPGRAAEFARSQGMMHKNDKLDSRMLQAFGAQLRRRHYFEPDTPEIQALRASLQRLQQLNRDLIRERNRLEKCSFIPASAELAASIKRQLRHLRTEKQKVQKHIDELIGAEPHLRHVSRLLVSIKGIGKLTAQRLLPLLYRERFDSARQFAAYLGLVPVRRQSGTSLNSRGQLGGRGHRSLRAALYMPAVCAITYDPAMALFHERLRQRGKLPKQALAAVMRKLAHVAWGVVHNDTPYQEHYAV